MTAAKKTDQADASGGQPGEGVPADAVELELARQLAERARAGGLSLAGPGGLLGRLTKVVLEGALEGELDAHLGYQKHDRPGGMAGTPATGTGPRPCSPTWGRWRSTCRGTAMPASPR
jgi:hypothetical protein